MARYFDGVNEHLYTNTVFLTTPPMAWCCWFNLDNALAPYCIMWQGSRFVDDHSIALYALGVFPGDPLRFQMQGGGAWATVNTTSGYAASTWHYACAIWVSATDIRVLIDGGSKGTALGVAAVTQNTLAIGVMKRLVPTGCMAGSVAEAAFYNLNYWPGGTAAQKADSFETILPSLAAGYSPLHFPVGLTAYWPLLRGDPDNENDRIGNHLLFAANTPSVTPHPRVILPQTPQQTTPRMVLPSFGKLRSVPTLTGKIISVPALTGKLKNRPALTGKLKSS